jgi:hypothetical protein
MKNLVTAGILLLAHFMINAQSNFYGLIGALPAGAKYNRDGLPDKSPVGHAMVGLGYYDEKRQMCVLEVFGHYPQDYVKTFEKLPFNEVPGEIKQDLETLFSNQAVFAVFPISQGQFNAVKQKKSAWNRAGVYALLEKDCVSFMQDAASLMGLKTPDRLTNNLLFPMSYMKSISAANNLSLVLGTKGNVAISKPAAPNSSAETKNNRTRERPEGGFGRERREREGLNGNFGGNSAGPRDNGGKNNGGGNAGARDNGGKKNDGNANKRDNMSKEKIRDRITPM